MTIVVSGSYFPYFSYIYSLYCLFPYSVLCLFIIIAIKLDDYDYDLVTETYLLLYI